MFIFFDPDIIFCIIYNVFLHNKYVELTVQSSILHLRSFQTATGICLHYDNIPIHESIVTALLPTFTRRFSRRLAARLFQIIEMHHLRRNKASLKVLVNATGRSRNTRATPERPRSDSALVGGEKLIEPQHLVALGDDIANGAGACVSRTVVVAFDRGGGHFLQTRFECSRKRHRRRSRRPTP